MIILYKLIYFTLNLSELKVVVTHTFWRIAVDNIDQLVNREV